jgi:hypothetical protein
MSCSEAEPYSVEEIDKTYIYINAPSTLTEDEGEFFVNSSSGWYVDNCPVWVNLSPRSGNYYQTVKYTLDENTTSSERTGTIRIMTNNRLAKDEIRVEQQPSTPFEATMSTTNYKSEGDYWFLNVKAGGNKSWTITKSVSWVHIGTSSNASNTYTGKGEATVNIYCDANTSTVSRSTTLTVTCGSKSETITITQEAKSNYTTFASWTSTNKSNPSNGYITYALSVASGNVLSFNYDISSEQNCDKFYATLERYGSTYATIVNGASGIFKNQYASYRFYTSGTFTLRLKYEKDGSVSKGNDNVYVYNIKLTK